MTNTEPGPDHSRSTRLEALVALKDFAVQRGYSVPESVINEVNALAKLKADAGGGPASDEKTDSKLDSLAIQLSQITFPVNLTNIKNAELSGGVTRFVYILLSWGILASIASGLLIWLIKAQNISGTAHLFMRPLLALFLGMVGAIVYVMLPNGKLNVVAGVDEASRANDIVRVAMGAILGFVLFLAAGLSKGSSAGATQSLEALELILPFIGGYSITLVIGVLAKAVAAIALTFGIDEKSIRSSLQK